MVMLSRLPTVSTPEEVIEPPMVIDWTVPGAVSDSEPLRLLVIAMVENSKPSRLRMPLKSPPQKAVRLSWFDDPPLIVVVAGRFWLAATLMLNVLPPEPRLMFRFDRPA